MTESIIIKEHSEKILDNCNLEKLKSFLSRNKLDAALKVTHNGIKTDSWVGVIKYKNAQFQILPKFIYTKEYIEQSFESQENIKRNILNNLIFMLSYTKKLDIKASGEAKLSTSKNPFIEVLIREFATSLFDSLKRFTPKKYVREEENINYLKGKLNFALNIKHNCANKVKFYCEYDEFSENNILNQLFLYVSTCLYNISNDNKNKKILKLIINYYADITFEKIDKFKIEKIKLTRNQTLFTKPFKLAKMFVEKTSVDLSNNKFENITLVWDMNKLFEEFVYELMRECQGEWNCKLTPQKGQRLLKNDYSKKRNTFVDIMIEKPNEKIVLDTKYKEFTDENDFTNADVFQVSTYCLLHNATHAILLYPEWDKEINAEYELNIIDNSISTNYNIDFRTLNLKYENLKDSLSDIKDKLRTILQIPRDSQYTN